jgi:uncharacterized YccA/Bax inhibitor family protein
VRTTSNPAFRNLPGGGQGGYAGFGSQQPRGLGYPAPPTSADRVMTIDDVVTKTAVTLATAFVTGGLTMYFHAYGLLLPAVIVGLVLSLIIIFKQVANPALVLAYSAAEGAALGAITGIFNDRIAGIAVQAILGTFSVFAAMLVVYRTGAVKVTPRLTKWIIGATAGAAILMLLNLVLSLFHINIGVRDGSPLSIVISLVFIGIAAFNFLLDFDQADRALRSGAPAKFAWYIAFGLMTTLVWLYLEMIRLLASLQRN